MSTDILDTILALRLIEEFDQIERIKQNEALMKCVKEVAEETGDDPNELIAEMFIIMREYRNQARMN